MSDVLTRMNVPHEAEALTEDGMFSLDIMLRQARIAVEVDGIHHFASNTQRPLGALLCACKSCMLSFNEHDLAWSAYCTGTTDPMVVVHS